MMAGARADSYSGTWSITPSSNAGQVHIELRYHHADATGSEEWDESHDMPAPQIRDNSFTISSDAGEFHAQGTFITPSQGGGIWTFTPSPTFASALERRGVGTPSEKDQFSLAMANFRLSTLDTLLASGFDRPSISDLVRMTQHGVSNDYVSQLKNVQFSQKNVESLVRLHDHGVTARYMQAMQSMGYRLSAEDLVRMVDHGVTVRYVQGLKDLGYRPSADELVRLVDHGVSLSFIQRMRSHGYTHLSADELIRLADNGF